MELNLNKKDGALPSAAEIQIARNLFPNSENPMQSYEIWKSSGMPIETTQKYGRAKGPSYPRPERPAVEFTINPNLGVFGNREFRITRPKGAFNLETSAQQESDKYSALYGLKTLPLYLFPLTEPLAVGIDLIEGVATRDPLQTGMAGFLSRSMSPKYQKLIAAGSVFMPFDAEAVKIVGSPGLFSAVVEKIKGAPSKARGEEVKQKPENWMGGMLKGGSTLKVNNIEIPIKTSEVENMMRLIKNNKLDDKLLTRDEMVKILEDQYYTSFITEKTNPQYFNRLGNMEVTKIELPKDGTVPRDLLEIANYTSRDAGLHHDKEQGIISHSLIKKDNNAYEITEIQSDMASDAHKFGIFGSPKNNLYQDLTNILPDFYSGNKYSFAFNDAGLETARNITGQTHTVSPVVRDLLNVSILPDEVAKKMNLSPGTTKGSAEVGTRLINAYSDVILDRYKKAIVDIDKAYSDEYLGKIYDLSTDKKFKSEYTKEQFSNNARRYLKGDIISSAYSSSGPNNLRSLFKNIIEQMDAGLDSSRGSAEAIDRFRARANNLGFSHAPLGSDTFNAGLEANRILGKTTQDLLKFKTHSVKNAMNAGSVPPQTPLMKNLDYVEFEIKKHLEKAANEDQPKFILPGEEPVRYWSDRGQDEQFLRTIYSLGPDSKKGYKGKIGQVLTKISKKYNIPFRLDGTTGYSEQSINNIFKKDLNGVRNLSDLSGEDAMNAADFVGNPLDEVLYGGTVQMRNRVRDFQDDFKEDWLQRNYYEEEPDPEAFSRAVDQANDEFQKQVIEDPSILVDRLDLLNVYDWDGISKGFEAMAKGSEFKDVRLASEMLGKIAERTREIFDYSLQSIKEHETLGIGDVNNLGDFFRNLVQDSNKIAKDEFVRNLSQSKKAELLELGVLSIEDGRFIVELPDTVKEQIIEQGFPITGL